jgi:hypothetical protein
LVRWIEMALDVVALMARVEFTSASWVFFQDFAFENFTRGGRCFSVNFDVGWKEQ